CRVPAARRSPSRSPPPPESAMIPWQRWEKDMACQIFFKALPRAPGSSLLGSVPSDQHSAPYLEALRAYARRNPARLHVPGHKGGPGADLELLEAIGERALSLDVPALTHGIDLGPAPTPFEAAQRLRRAASGGAAPGVL